MSERIKVTPEPCPCWACTEARRLASELDAKIMAWLEPEKPKP